MKGVGKGGRGISMRKFQKNRLFRVRESSRKDIESILQAAMQLLDTETTQADKRAIGRILTEVNSDSNWIQVSSGKFKDIWLTKEEAEVVNDISSAFDLGIEIKKVQNQ